MTTLHMPVINPVMHTRRGYRGASSPKVTSPHPDLSGHDIDDDAGYDRHGQYRPAVIEAVCCLSSSAAFLVKEAIKELGYEQPAPLQRPCTGRLDLLRNQLVSPGPTAGRFACTSRMLMQAVREGYRSHKGGPFHVYIYIFIYTYIYL